MVAPAWLLFVAYAVAGSAAGPPRYWQHQSDYAGWQKCAVCHPAIAKVQAASNHALSMRPIEEITEFISRLPYRRLDASIQTELELLRNPGGDVGLVARHNGSEARLVLRWALGGGSKGITPLGQHDSGRFVEGRLSWYRALGTFDLTPGATERVPGSLAESLGKLLSEKERAECFACHTTRSDAARAVPARADMGIRCERCHGPGLEHIHAIQTGHPPEKKIFHPGKLDGLGQAQFCGACHGNPPEETDFNAIRNIREAPLAVRFPPQRLVLSRCFTETDGGLRCTTCHDPHANISESSAYYDDRCLSCHRTGMRKNATVCRVGVSACISCHMPRRQVMVHATFADHWIRVVRGPQGD